MIVMIMTRLLLKELSYDTTLKTQFTLSEVNNSLKITDIYPLTSKNYFKY